MDQVPMKSWNLWLLRWFPVVWLLLWANHGLHWGMFSGFLWPIKWRIKFPIHLGSWKLLTFSFLGIFLNVDTCLFLILSWSVNSLRGRVRFSDFCCIILTSSNSYHLTMEKLKILISALAALINSVHCKLATQNNIGHLKVAYRKVLCTEDRFYP